MFAPRGKSDIGDKVNIQIAAPRVQADEQLELTDFPDLNNFNKLGEGQAKVELLTQAQREL